MAGWRGGGTQSPAGARLAAGLGITSHMVLQLARVYKQKIDLDTAGKLLSELGTAPVGRRSQYGGAGGGGWYCLAAQVGAGRLTSGGVLQGLVQCSSPVGSATCLLSTSATN